jgi:hypothetical protein
MSENISTQVQLILSTAKKKASSRYMVLKFKYHSENIYLLVASRLFVHTETHRSSYPISQL